jgi:hypothetical protein
MPSLKHIPRQAIVGLWLFVCLAPFAWILFIHENRLAWIELWPVLPGMVVGVLTHSISHSSGSVSVTLSAVISLVISATVLILLWRISHRRLTVALLSLTVYCFFSWFAYKLYLL